MNRDLIEFTHLRGFEVWGFCQKCGVFTTQPSNRWAYFKKYVLRKNLTVINSSTVYCSNKCFNEAYP